MLRPLNLRTWLVPLSLGVVVASCSTPTDNGGYVLTMRANVTGIATIDSVRYVNNAGVTVSVIAPAANWIVTQSPTAVGATVNVTLFGSGTAAGTAKLVVLWMRVTGEMQGDSVTATTAAATKFTATIPPRTI